MRCTPVATGALALLDDYVDRGVRGHQVRHRHELRPPEDFFGRLGPLRADEHRTLTKTPDEVAEAVGDATVEVPNGGEVLNSRQLFVGPESLVRRSGHEPLGVE